MRKEFAKSHHDISIGLDSICSPNSENTCTMKNPMLKGNERIIVPEQFKNDLYDHLIPKMGVFIWIKAHSE